MAHKCLFLDPGVLLNLCIIDEGAEVLAALPYRTLITSAISNATYPIDHDGETITYSAEALVTQGVLAITDLDAEHASERFIELACLGLRGTLGELAVLASACEGVMGTDDQATTNLMTSVLPEVPLLTTAALIHEYAVLTKPPRSRVAYILTRIQEHAAFAPNERDPFRNWWYEQLK